jgi:hypothetical protein
MHFKLVAIFTIISLPFLCDIHKAIVTRCGKKQLSENLGKNVSEGKK